MKINNLTKIMWIELFLQSHKIKPDNGIKIFLYIIRIFMNYEDK